MNRRRVILAVVALLASSLLAAGCGGAGGGDGGASAAGSVPASASLAPADATAFVTVSTDVDGKAWRDAGALVDLVPGVRRAVDGLADDRDGLSWARDVRPMLGRELVVVVTRDAKPILLVQPRDEAAFERVVRAGDESVVVGEVDGWTAAAPDRASLDAYTAALAAGTIAGSSRFTASMEALPGDAIARAYASGANLMDSVRQLAAVGGTAKDVAFESLSMAVVPQRAGVFLTATVRASGGDGTSYEPTLLGRVPGDAVLALSFGATQKTADGIIDKLRLDKVSRALEDVAGVSLDGVLGLFSGEGILYLRAGTPVPELTLVLAPPDVDGAFRDVETIVRNLAKDMDAPVEESEQDGVTVSRVDAGTVNVRYARLDDAVVVTTGASGIRRFREDGDKLRDAEAFARAADEVDLGDRTSGFLYVDVDGLVPLAEGLADTADTTLPDGVREALEAFDSVILTGAGDGDGATTMSGFVAVNGA